MVRLNATFDNHKPFPVAKLFQYLLQLCLDLLVKNPKPILRYPDKMVLALIYNMRASQIPFHASILTQRFSPTNFFGGHIRCGAFAPTPHHRFHRWFSSLINAWLNENLDRVVNEELKENKA